MRDVNVEEIEQKIYFEVPGEPKGKGRPRFVRKTGHAITPKDTAVYENLVRIEYQRWNRDFIFPADAMVRVDILAYYSIPSSTSKIDRELMKTGQIRPTKKPDCDNVVKIICDALNQLAYHDDSQIVDCAVRKFYSENPRVSVVLSQTGTKSEVRNAEKARRKQERSL